MKKYLLLLMILSLATFLVVPAFAEATAPAAVTSPIDLTPIVQALVTIFAAIITVKVVPWIKARTTAEQQALLSGITRTVVYAAEQIYGSGTGKKKLMYVKSRLKDKGYDIDIDVIEAAVKELGKGEPAIGETITVETEVEIDDATDQPMEPPDSPDNPEK